MALTYEQLRVLKNTLPAVRDKPREHGPAHPAQQPAATLPGEGFGAHPIVSSRRENAISLPSDVQHAPCGPAPIIATSYMSPSSCCSVMKQGNLKPEVPRHFSHTLMSAMIETWQTKCSPQDRECGRNKIMDREKRQTGLTP